MVLRPYPNGPRPWPKRILMLAHRHIKWWALDEPVLLAPSDSRYTQVGLNLISVQVCLQLANKKIEVWASYSVLNQCLARLLWKICRQCGARSLKVAVAGNFLNCHVCAMLLSHECTPCQKSNSRLDNWQGVQWRGHENQMGTIFWFFAI